MTRFDARPDLFEYMDSRTKGLKVSKTAYVLALIEQDKANGGGKWDPITHSYVYLEHSFLAT